MTQLKQCAEALREKFILKKRDNLRCRYVTDQEIEDVIRPFFNQWAAEVLVQVNSVKEEEE